MIDQSLIKSNFLGRDGFRWWIGQIPPIESQGKQANGGGWGNRCKVRILGYHPYNPAELSNDDLPWAQVLLPTTSGSGGANYAVNPKLTPGDMVFGFFLDGDNGQVPVIMGCFGRTDKVSKNEYVIPFMPFTGYTDKIPKPNGGVYPSEASEQNTSSQKSPRDVPQSVISKLNNTKENKDEIPYYTGVGKKIVFADTCNNTSVKGIISEVSNLLDKVQNVLNSAVNIATEINRSVEKIVSLANNIIGQMFNSLFNKLIPILQKGLSILFKAVYAKILAITRNPIIAHLAGVAAQQAMTGPVKALEEAISCAAGKVVSGLSGIVRDLLKSLIDNVQNFVTCAGNQFTGSFLNKIISDIVNALSGPLKGVTKILAGGLNVANFLRSGIDAIKSIGGLFDCNQGQGKCSGLVKEWTVGKGAKGSENEDDTFNKILDNMNVSAAIGDLGNDFEKQYGTWDIFSVGTTDPTSNSPLGGCYTGKPTSCGPPKVKIFGGGGSGALATAILGSFAVNNIASITSQRTASIIGVRVDAGGSGYRYPPFVEFVDNCNQGYGAIARSVINDQGEVIAIYIVSPGENYPVGDVNIESSASIAETDPQYSPYGVVSVVVETSGIDYSLGDYAIDNFGNTYNLTIENGNIISAELPRQPIGITTTGVGANPNAQQQTIKTSTITNEAPINTNVISDLPIIRIKSDTGIGAVLRPIVGKLSTTPQGELKTVIDCVK
jgi:hypothetical protein